VYSSKKLFELFKRGVTLEIRTLGGFGVNVNDENMHDPAFRRALYTAITTNPENFSISPRDKARLTVIGRVFYPKCSK
jgi:hypothetical protein